MLACEMLVILNPLDMLSIGGYVLSLFPTQNIQNSGIESVKWVCFDIISIPFFKVSIDILIWKTHMTNLVRSAKYDFVSHHTKAVKYKPELPYSKFKKLALDLEYVINEADRYDEVVVVGKLFNFSERKISDAGNKYIECTTVDATNRERLLKIISKVK